ncbi:MAG: glycosyltransferase [Formivibrio sp.]|nr:glycosyltransferase [Formivibrio sp.]
MRVRSFYHIRMGRFPEVMERRGWEWWGLYGALKLAYKVVVLDKRSEEAMKRFLPSERVVRLPNGIDLLPLSDGRTLPKSLIVLYAGHLIPTKGLKELMEAWRELRPQGWCLWLAGRGSDAYKKELVGIVGPHAGVEFLGDLPPKEAWECMQIAQIFVLPTYTEGFPNVILEAMAAGKAIISTHVGAIPEMLDADSDEPCGLVIKPRDAEILVASLRQLLLDSQLRETLGRRARAKVAQSYTTGVVFSRLLHLWSDGASTKDCADEQMF